MDIDNLEKSLNSYGFGDMSNLIGSMFELQLQNNALLRTILINQAKQEARTDSSKTSEEYEKEFIELANKLQHEKMAELLSKKPKR